MSESRQVKTKYDAVVVGAGCAGLSAALRMALAGKKTLLIEQHNLPGGCATSIVRGGYEMETSLHELCEVGPETMPGSVRRLFREYGVEMEWIELKDCFRMISVYSDGTPLDVTMPHGVEAFIAKMEQYVPGSTPKMRDLFEILEEICRGTEEASDPEKEVSAVRMMKRYPNMLRLGSYPVSRVFEAMKLPQKCRDILSVYWSYLGVDLNHLSFFHYASMVYRYVVLGAYMPKHTSHELSTALLSRFYELGGEAWFNCRAEEFLFTGDAVSGVRTTMGDVSCDVCLANINPDIIYGKMMPKELVPEREKKLSAARNRDFRTRWMTAFFILDREAGDLGIENYVYFLGDTADSEKEYDALQAGIDSNRFCIFLCPNIANPEASPEGTCMCSITTMGSRNDWEELSQEDYFKQKEKVFEKMFGLVKEKTGVELKGHVLEICTASPWTYARFLNTPEGTPYGYAVTEWDSIAARTMMIDRDYPVKGLYPIGAAGPRGDGYSGNYSTGSILGKRALLYLAGKAEEGGRA